LAARSTPSLRQSCGRAQGDDAIVGVGFLTLADVMVGTHSHKFRRDDLYIAGARIPSPSSMVTTVLFLTETLAIPSSCGRWQCCSRTAVPAERTYQARAGATMGLSDLGRTCPLVRAALGSDRVANAREMLTVEEPRVLHATQK
jgi:hypothetical protein